VIQRNLVPNLGTSDGEAALPELGLCSHDNICVNCRRTELPASRFSTVKFHSVTVRVIVQAGRIFFLLFVSSEIVNFSALDCMKAS